MEQLREMRTSRMQQLRQSNQQATLLNRQTAVMSNVYNILGRQLAVSNRLDSNQKITIRQTAATNTSLNNLSKSMAKSIGSLSMSIGRGAAGAVGSAGRGVSAVGGAAVGGVSAISSGILTGLAKVLPTAIIGYLGKTMLWDNMEDATKGKLQTAFSGLMEKMMIGVKGTDIGKQIDPLTEKLGDHLEVLGESFDKLSTKISKMVQSISKVVPPMPSMNEVKEKATDIKNTVEKRIEAAKPDIKRAAVMTRITGEQLQSAGNTIMQGVEIGRDISRQIPEGPAGITETAIVGTGVVAAAAGARKLYKPKAGSPAAPPAPAPAPAPAAKAAAPPAATSTKSSRLDLMRKVSGGVLSAESKAAQETLKKAGIPLTKQGVAIARTVNKLVKGSFKGAATLLDAVMKYKLTKFGGVLGLLLEGGQLAYLSVEIDAMKELGELNDEEAAALWQYSIKMAGASVAGGLVVGTLGAAAGGGWFSVPLAIAGGIAGSTLAQKAVEMTSTLPSSLTTEITQVEADKPSAMSVTSPGKITNKRQEKGKKQAASSASSVKPTGAGTSSGAGATGSTDKAMKYFMSKGWTREQAAGIVGNLQHESNMKTNIEGDKNNKKGSAWGIAQWRTERLAKFKEMYGKDVKDASFEEQLDFVQWELTHDERSAGGLLQQATTADQAALVVDWYYERSDRKATTKRQANALALMGITAGADTQMATNAVTTKPQASATDTANNSRPSKPYPDTAMVAANGSQSSNISSEDTSPADNTMSFADRVAAKSKARQERKDIESSFDTTAEMKKPAAVEDKKIGLGTSLMGFLHTSQSDITAQILEGLNEIQQFDIQKNVSTPMVINNKGGDTIVSSSSGGGGGGASSSFAPIGMSAGYDSRFKSLAGVG